jgi:hypothetical protein
MKEYSDRELNQMICFLKVTNVAQIQYISRNNPDNEDAGDLILYDYATQSHLTEKQLVATALDSGFELNKHINWEEVNGKREEK